MMHETNTFSPVPTPLASFRPLSGEAAIAEFKDTNTQLGGFLDIAQRDGRGDRACRSRPARIPRATSSGGAYEDMCDAIVGGIRGGCDAAFLALHGAMVAEHVDDGEGELLRRIRAVAPRLPIAVGPRLPHADDAARWSRTRPSITGYRTYPHIDMAETAQRAAPTLVRALDGEVKPAMVWGFRPMLTSTLEHTPSRQPMKDVMDMAIDAERTRRRAQRVGVRRLPAVRHPAPVVLGDRRVRRPHGPGPGAARSHAGARVGAPRRLPLPRRAARDAGRARAHARRRAGRSSSITATTPRRAARRT